MIDPDLQEIPLSARSRKFEKAVEKVAQTHEDMCSKELKKLGCVESMPVDWKDHEGLIAVMFKAIKDLGGEISFHPDSVGTDSYQFVYRKKPLI